MHKDLTNPSWLTEHYQTCSLQEIANQLGVCRNTVRNQMLKFGIERKPRGTHLAGKPKPPEQRAKMAEARRAFWQAHPDRDAFKLKISTSKARTRLRAGYRRIYIIGRGRIMEHRYVAEQILGRPLRPDEHVHHIDGDRLNNAPENLRIVDNLKHQTFHAQKLTEDNVKAIRYAWEHGDATQAALAQQYGVCHASIQRIVHYKRWKR